MWQEITVVELVQLKTSVEIQLNHLVEEHIMNFEKVAGVPVKAISIHLINVTDPTGMMNDHKVAQTKLHLDIDSL